jgi:hypothetical protein
MACYYLTKRVADMVSGDSLFPPDFQVPGQGADGGEGKTDVQGESSPASTADTARDPFEDSFTYFDDIHGAIKLNQLEADVIQTPEFRRLFHLAQLGLVPLVYPTASHSRGMHSIAACHWAGKLADCLNQNTQRLARQLGFKPIQITRAERVLIRLAALLHDISHGPLSHDIERKTHYVYHGSTRIRVKSQYGLYEKHDDYKANPVLYILLMDPKRSVLARVLREYSRSFVDLLLGDVKSAPRLNGCGQLLVEWHSQACEDILPSLLFHLLIYEKPEEAHRHPIDVAKEFDRKPEAWTLGPKGGKLHQAWYQPYRHDIIGDTLSADLLEYLQRDQDRLGLKNRLDLKLLDFYVLVPWKPAQPDPDCPPTFWNDRYRCAIDLMDHKRGTFRSERLNDIFRMLDLRHEIHEKAVHHRVVQSAIAMLGRAGQILRDQNCFPELPELYGLPASSGTSATSSRAGSQPTTPVLCGDDHFLSLLLQKTNEIHTQKTDETHNHSASMQPVEFSMVWKLVERRLFRPLLIIPGDRVPALLGNGSSSLDEHQLRWLAATVDGPFFQPFFRAVSAAIQCVLEHSLPRTVEQVAEWLRELDKIPRPSDKVIFHTTPYKQLYKDPKILVAVSRPVSQTQEGLLVDTLENLKDQGCVSGYLRDRVKAGIRDAETKNEALWKIYVFISDGLFYTGTLARLLSNLECAKQAGAHRKCLLFAAWVAAQAIRFAYDEAVGMRQHAPEDSSEYWLNGLPGEGDSADLVKRFSYRLQAEPVTSDRRGLDWLGNWLRNISAVQVDQYLHQDSPDSRLRKCRDIRSRYHEQVDAAAVGQLVAALVPDPAKQPPIEGLIKAAISSGNTIGKPELEEIALRLGGASLAELQKLDAAKAARGQAFDDALRSIWHASVL